VSVEERWRGRPKVALAVKTLIVALPLAASIVVSRWAASRLPHPAGRWQISLWGLALMAISVIVLMVGEAIARRFLPLVALLRLSLLFPGPAPSRIGVARASTRAELRRLSALVEREGMGTDLATVARTLVILVGALDVHDRSTRGHSERVRVYADMLADASGSTSTRAIACDGLRCSTTSGSCASPSRCSIGARTSPRPTGS
jgi:hypothetical protein